jgi:hypothetical protein
MPASDCKITGLTLWNFPVPSGVREEARPTVARFDIPSAFEPSKEGIVDLLPLKDSVVMTYDQVACERLGAEWGSALSRKRLCSADFEKVKQDWYAKL